MTSVMNAVVDALREVGITHFDMPASPRSACGVLYRSADKASANCRKGDNTSARARSAMPTIFDSA